MSLAFIIICAVAMTGSYICLGINVAYAVRDARNAAEELGIQPSERHWRDFTEYLTDYGWQLFTATFLAVTAVVALVISEFC